MSFHLAIFEAFVLQHRVMGFFERPVTLKSGRISHWYVNWRAVVSDAFLLDQLTDFVVAFLESHHIHPKSILGVPEGATKPAVIAALKWARSRSDFAPGSHRIPLARTTPKEHGDPKDRFFVGEPSGPTVVLEDVTTTGGSLVAVLDRLREADIPVVAVISFTNRMERREDGLSVADFLERQYKVPFLAMSEAHRLLPQAITRYCPPENVIASVVSGFQEYGVMPLDETLLS